MVHRDIEVLGTHVFISGDLIGDEGMGITAKVLVYNCIEFLDHFLEILLLGGIETRYGDMHLCLLVALFGWRGFGCGIRHQAK